MTQPRESRTPRFGQKVTNSVASESNPHRTGTFVRVVHVTGRMNRGTWWELTDERGVFWQAKPSFCIVGAD